MSTIATWRCKARNCRLLATEGDNRCGRHSKRRKKAVTKSCVTCGAELKWTQKSAERCAECRAADPDTRDQLTHATVQVAEERARARVEAMVRRIDPAEHMAWLAAQGRTR